MKKILLTPQCVHGVVSNEAPNKKYFKIAFVLNYWSFSEILPELNPRSTGERDFFLTTVICYIFFCIILLCIITKHYLIMHHQISLNFCSQFITVILFH